MPINKKYVRVGFNIFFYTSILFFLFKLYHADYLIVPKLSCLYFLILSLLFTYGGFIMDSFCWYAILRKLFSDKILFKDALISQGISTFGKYLPGKFWTILGRGAFIALKYSGSEATVTILSLQSQLIFLWSGLFLSILLFLFIHIDIIWLILSLVLIIFFSLFLFSLKINKLLIRGIKHLKINLTIPYIENRIFLVLLPMFLITWLFWSIGFCLFVASLQGSFPPAITLLFFPFAASIGMLAFFAPGGLGAREGILLLLLTAIHLSSELATSIAISSRIWFLSGEIFIFLLALLVKLWNKIIAN
jgi:glycosyltransferase 2 family protein